MKPFTIMVFLYVTSTVFAQEDVQWKQIGIIAPRHAKEIRSSNWSVGAEMLDRDWTIYENWKSYLGPLGAKKARLQSGWAKTEKSKGLYDFAWLDAVIHDMNAQGVRPWVSLSYGNPLYTGGGGTSLNAAVPKSPEAIEAWKRYVKACITRYKNDVDEWEVWNEPNYRIDAGDYASFFMTTAEIIRAEQPDATIIAFAIGSGVDYMYVDKVLEIIQKQNKINLIDQITHHRHISIPERNDPEMELEKVVSKYNPAIIIRQGEGGCPSQRNEGYALNHFDWTETTQAKHISRRLLSDLGRDKESSCFTIMESRSPEEWNYKGLLKANPDSTVAYAKPAYRAFQHITSIFDDQLERIKQYRYAAETVGESNISLYAYKDKANNQVVTIWFNDKIPSDDHRKSFRDFTFYEGQFNHPVWVDIVSGKVYDIPKNNWSKIGTRYDFKQIPVYDSPVLIADLSVLKIGQLNALSDKEIVEGWINMFNGKDFSGWRGYSRKDIPKVWTIEDHSIKIQSMPGTRDRDGGSIIFGSKFRNFDLRFDWRVAKGANSGVFYFVLEGQGYAVSKTGLEYHILDNIHHPDAKKGHGGNRTSAAMYDLIPPVIQNALPYGEWNTGVIVVNRGKVIHYQNHVKVLETQLWTEEWREKVDQSKFKGLEEMIHAGETSEGGYIALQDHQDDVWFRNIKIKKLD